MVSKATIAKQLINIAKIYPESQRWKKNPSIILTPSYTTPPSLGKNNRKNVLDIICCHVVEISIIYTFKLK